MKRIAMIITMVVMAAIISGFTVNAEQNTDVNYPTLNITNNEEGIEPYRVEIEEVVEELEIPEDETREGESVVSGGASWIFAKTQEGEKGSKTTQYERLFNKSGSLLSRIEIPGAEEIIEAKPTVYEGGQVAQEGAIYEASEITRYGGGSKTTTSGVDLAVNSVKQQDGSWEDGITYEGYYIVAASSAIPLFSILEVSDHSLNGMGLKSEVPFKAIVLDRSSAIQGSKMELFVGTDNQMPVSIGESKDAKVEILSTDNKRLVPVVEEVKVVETPKASEAVAKPAAAPAQSNNAVQAAPSTGGASNEISHLTRYGVDCYGCNLSAEGRGATASGLGVGLSSVRQSNGTWQEGITYDGYYVVAAASHIPINSIVEISNHTLSGSGITPGVPFKAIVADRGGGITGSRIDLFVGSESNMLVGQGSQYNAQIRIIG